MPNTILIGIDLSPAVVYIVNHQWKSSLYQCISFLIPSSTLCSWPWSRSGHSGQLSGLGIAHIYYPRSLQKQPHWYLSIINVFQDGCKYFQNYNCSVWSGDKIELCWIRIPNKNFSNSVWFWMFAKLQTGYNFQVYICFTKFLAHSQK